MMFAFNNNPIDKLVCWFYNTKEDISQVLWRKGTHKTAECRLCGEILDSHKDEYSPMQCGWHKVTKYSWICHSCFDHRNFRPFIEMIDEADRLRWEEHNLKAERIRNKAQEVIDLLKEYLPEYKETLDLYTPYGDLDYYDDDGQPDEFWFSFEITDKDETYVLEINSDGIFKTSINSKDFVMESIAYYVNDDIIYQRTEENPWTWDDSIVEIKRQIAERKEKDKG